jgi:hypothetical protein
MLQLIRKYIIAYVLYIHVLYHPEKAVLVAVYLVS